MALTSPEFKRVISNNPGIENGLGLFLSHPVIWHQPIILAENPIFQEFRASPGLLKERLSLFKQFFYDTGLASDIKIKDDDHIRILGVNPDFSREQVGPVFIYNRQVAIRMAADGLLNNKNIALMHFDIKDLRSADQAGYAEFLLRDFAEILNTKAQELGQNREEWIAARIGGDEFCLLHVSQEKINTQKHIELQKIYEAVAEQFAQKDGYFMLDEDLETIEKRKATLKYKKEELIKNIMVVTKSDDRGKVLRALAAGRVPTKATIEKERRVSKKEKHDLEKSLTVSYEYKPYVKEDLFKEAESFLKSHPEFIEEIGLIKEVAGQEKLDLANYLFYLIKQSLFDPLLGRSSHSLPGFVRHLQAREQKKANEKLVYIYFPWLKNLNQDYGEAWSDEQIILPLGQVVEKTFPSREKDNDGRRGADFFLVNPDFVADNVQYLDLEEEHPVWGKKVPYFINMIDMPDRKMNIDQVITNMKYAGSLKLIGFFNDMFSKSPEQAKKVLAWYLSARTDSRCRALRRMLLTLKEPNDDFRSQLEEKLNPL